MVSDEIIVLGAAFFVVVAADGAVVTMLALLKVAVLGVIVLVSAVPVLFSKRT